MNDIRFTIIDNKGFHERFDSSASLHFETLAEMKGCIPHFIDPSTKIVWDDTWPESAPTVYFPFFIREPFTMETMDFCSLIDADHLKLLKEEKLVPIIFMISEAWPIFERGPIRSTYSKVISQFEKHGIKEQNIVWLVCVKDFIPDWVKAKFIHFDYFLEEQKKMKMPWLELKQINKVFISMGRGVKRHHRYGMTYSLYKNDLLKHGKVSCAEYDDFKYMNGGVLTTNQYLASLDCWDGDSCDNFIKSLPYDIDKPNNDKVLTHANGQDETFLLEDVFVNLVNETHQIDHLTFVTEKTYRCINLCRPFLINGDNGTLAYLKEMGFKTFSDFWDESYDDMGTTDFDKISKLTKILKNLCAKPKEELLAMFKEMTPILEHNHKHLMDFKQWHKLNIK